MSSISNDLICEYNHHKVEKINRDNCNKMKMAKR